MAVNISLYGNIAYSAPPASVPDFTPIQINLLDISIPKDMGSIKEKFEGQNEKTVFIIQDAHEIPDAQRSVQKLIDFLQTKYGIRLVALEGAASDLDPQIFKSFPDQTLLKKVFEQYFDQGELAGGTAAAIFNPSPSIYHGVEDWGLYEEGLKHFLDSMEIEERVTQRLDRLFDEIKLEKEKHYSTGLMRIDLALQDFRKNTTDLVAILEKLAAVLPPEKDSELGLLLEEVGRSRENNNPIETEVKRIAEQIGSFLRQKYSAEAKQDLAEFNQKFQEFQTQRSAPEAFALFLKGLALKHRIKVKVSKRLNYLVGNQKRMKDIEGTKFFDDFQKYAQSVKEALFQNDEERKLDARSRQLELLERLAKLELSREDWNEVKEIFNEIQYWNATKSDSGENGDLAKLLGEMRPQVSFYHNAGKRDHAFIQQVNSLFQKHKTKSATFIAGGFHAEGVTYALKSQGISYVLVMPNINRIPDETHYRDHMKGEVSWGDYFEVQDGKVNLYDAFVRGTRDLLLKLSKEERGKFLKSWRDQIIRDLAEKGKLSESKQYTRFIDEVSEGRQKSGHLSVWEANINRFIEQLSGLRSEGQLTEDNIAQLFSSHSIPAGATGVPIAKSELRIDLLPNLSIRKSAVIKSLNRAEVRQPDDPSGSVTPRISRRAALGVMASVAIISGITGSAIWFARQSKDTSKFQILSESTIQAETLTFVIAPEILESPMYANVIKAFDRDGHQVRIEMIIQNEEMKDWVFRYLQLHGVQDFQSRLQFVITSEKYNYQYARDVFMTLVDNSSRSYSFISLLDVDDTEQKTTALAQAMSRLNQKIPDIAELPIPGGDIGSDDRYIYVGQPSIDKLIRSGKAQNADDAKNLVEKVTGRELIVLSGDDNHQDRYHMPIGVTQKYGRVSLLADPVMTLEAISKLSNEEKEKAKRHFMNSLPIFGETMADEVNRIFGLSPEEMSQKIKEVKGSKYWQSLERVKNELEGKGIHVVRVPTYSPAYKEKTSERIGFYHINLLQNASTDSDGNVKHSVIYPTYQIPSLDNQFLTILKSLEHFDNYRAVDATLGAWKYAGLHCFVQPRGFLPEQASSQRSEVRTPQLADGNNFKPPDNGPVVANDGRFDDDDQGKFGTDSGIVGAMHHGQTLFEEMKERFGKVLERHGWDKVIDQLERRRDGNADVLKGIRDMLDELVEAGVVSREQADMMASRIIPILINEDKLERDENELGGLIVRHNGVLKILFPLQRLDKANRKDLGDLLHELVEIGLLENGYVVDEAHRQAQVIQEAFERGDVAFAQFMIKDLLNIFSEWRDAAGALDGINKMPAAPALNRLNAIEAFLRVIDDDAEFKYLFARIGAMRQGLEKDIALKKIAATKGRQFFDVTGWLADDFGDDGWGHVTVGDVLVKVAVDGEGHLDPGFNIDNQGIFVNRGPGQAARVRLQNNAGMAPLMFSDQKLRELGIQITKIAEPVIREKVPLMALTEEAKLRAIDVILNEMEYQKRPISENEIKKISKNLGLDEQTVRARVNPKESFAKTPKKNEIVGAAHRNNAAASVVDALKPDSGQGLSRSEVRQVYELTTSDFDGFMDAIVETWLNRTKETGGLMEENVGVGQVALDESRRLIDHLRASREAESLSTGSITIGLRLSAQDSTSFLAQLFKVLQNSSESAEVLAEADTVKTLPVTKDSPSVAVRPVKPMDWTRGFKALRSEQENVPVALDVKLMNEQMEGMFNGILLNWGEAKPQRLVEDFGELLFAVALVEMAKIFADPNHKKELTLRKSDPKAKADYLRTQLLQRLADLGYPQEMFAFGENGYLTIQGTIANAFLEMKARAEVRKSA